MYDFVNKYLICLLCLSALMTACRNKEPALPDTDTIVYHHDTSPDSLSVRGLLSVQAARAMTEGDTAVILFEISKPDEYVAGHLPGAYHLWRPDYTTDENPDFGGMRGTAVEVADLLGRKGVASTDTVLLYDTKGGSNALRLAWILDMYGHPHTRIINGGKTAWKCAGYPLTEEVPPPRPPVGYAFPTEPNLSQSVNLREVKAAIGDTGVVLLDVREREEYAGLPVRQGADTVLWKKGAFAGGCIPGAVHLNWSEAVDLHGDHRFKSLKDLRYNFNRVGVTPDKDIIVYCHSGVRSAHTTYVLREILGYPCVRNYDGSWIEWSHRFVHFGDTEIEQIESK